MTQSIKLVRILGSKVRHPRFCIHVTRAIKEGRVEDAGEIARWGEINPDELCTKWLSAEYQLRFVLKNYANRVEQL